MASVHDFSAKTIKGQEQALSDYRGKVLLIVNVASKCGFTPQYKGLQALYDQHCERGLTVLGFPCDQFLHQEPGSDSEIEQFCSLNFGVSFPLFSKIEVNGERTHPLYQHLKAQAPGLAGTQAIKWNFTKFLVDRQGRVLERFAPNTTPEELAPAIEKALAA
jgi:glutathione peroxidase